MTHMPSRDAKSLSHPVLQLATTLEASKTEGHIPGALYQEGSPGNPRMGMYDNIDLRGHQGKVSVNTDLGKVFFQESTVGERCLKSQHCLEDDEHVQQVCRLRSTFLEQRNYSTVSKKGRAL